MNGPGEPWASIYTKRPAGLDLLLAGPKNRFALGRVAALGHESELNTQQADKDVVKLRFVDASEVASPELAEFLREHYAAVAETTAQSLSPSFRRAAAAKSV